MSNTIIATNVMALNSHRALTGVGGNISKASEKLSSGYRINRAADDAAGLAISEKMRSQIRGLDQASRNSQDGISMIQTAEGALQETQNMLQRMRELVVQASNDTYTQSDRDKVALELDELIDEINATADKTEFNQKKLIDGSWQNSDIYLQTGANKSQGLAFNIGKMDATVLGVTKGAVSGVVRGNSGLTENVANVNWSNPNDLKAITGAYDFGKGNTITVNSDATITVTGEFEGTNGKLSSGTYDLNVLANDKFFVPGATASTDASFEINSGKLSFTAAKATANDIAAIGVSDTGYLQDGTLIIATDDGTDVTGYQFKNGDGGKLILASGDTVEIDPDKKYTVAELAGAKLISSDGQMIKFDAAGEIAAQTSTFTNSIRFSPALDADGKPTSAGKVISGVTETIDKALEMVSSQRAKLGAYQNRLEHTIKNLETTSENLSASESRIRDTDMAKEMMKLTQNNVLQQAATAMLAQANQAPQNILKLLQ